MLEHLIIGLIFLVALIYLLVQVRNAFQPKNTGCAKGCGACSSIDFNKIEAEIARKKIATTPK